MKRIASLLFLLAFSGVLLGQETTENEPAKIVVTPGSLTPRGRRDGHPSRRKCWTRPIRKWMSTSFSFPDHGAMWV